MCPSGNVKVFRAGWTGAAGGAAGTAGGAAGAAGGAAGAAGGAGTSVEGTSALGVAVGVARAVAEGVAEALRLGAALCAVAFSAGWGPQAESTRLRVRPVIVTALQSLKRLDVMFLVPPERRVIAQCLPPQQPLYRDQRH